MLFNDLQALNRIHYKTMHNIFDRRLRKGMETSWETLQSFHPELSNSLAIGTKAPLAGIENDTRLKCGVKEETLAEGRSS